MKKLTNGHLWLTDRNNTKRNGIPIHRIKENQHEDTDEVVLNELKSDMDLEISPGDIDRTHGIGVPSKGKNRPIIIKFVRYMEGGVYLLTKRD